MFKKWQEKTYDVITFICATCIFLGILFGWFSIYYFFISFINEDDHVIIAFLVAMGILSTLFAFEFPIIDKLASYLQKRWEDE